MEPPPVVCHFRGSLALLTLADVGGAFFFGGASMASTRAKSQLVSLPRSGQNHDRLHHATVKRRVVVVRVNRSATSGRALRRPPRPVWWT